ncbi:MAG TPA: redox-sensing transcriptional repressor Rex [Actinomycetota bacterium]|jgi:redox-sensing transcriptional repressor|nr:redox-sensing transcriptional repressor Rex [Actinomycetota bacterium]
MRDRPIPEATVSRLPVYLRALLAAAESGGDEATISSEDLASRAGVNAAKVRKDLSYLGSYGTRGVGYDVKHLLFQITRELGLTQDWPAAIAGAGNLGRALASYKGFGERGFQVRALFDVDESVVGATVAGVPVRHMDELKDVAVEEGLLIGIIATPSAAAQEVAERFVDAGIKSILNFAPAVVNVPPDVNVRKVDLAIELQILSFYQQRNQAIETARAANERLERQAGRERA